MFGVPCVPLFQKSTWWFLISLMLLSFPLKFCTEEGEEEEEAGEGKDTKVREAIGKLLQVGCSLQRRKCKTISCFVRFQEREREREVATDGESSLIVGAWCIEYILQLQLID